MTATALALALTGVSFIAHDIPGLSVDSVDPFTGQNSGRFRNADLDGDGHPDLLLADSAYRSVDGWPDAAAAIEMPELRAACDVWQGLLYCRVRAGLDVMEWGEGHWRPVLTHDIVWARWRPPDDSGGLWFERFLHDMDADGVPEIVIPAATGLSVYVRDETVYREAAVLDVLPPMALCTDGPQRLWPADARSIRFPSRAMHCRLWLDGRHVTVITDEEGRGGEVWHVRRFAVDPRCGFEMTELESMQIALPPGFEPCALNGDGMVDFAGGDWSFSDRMPVPSPVFETQATTDGGRSIQVRRSRSFTPKCSFIDFDGDGDADMITESMGVFDGGVRETANRMLTSRDVAHAIEVRFQDARGRFSEKADVCVRVTISLDKPLWRQTDFGNRYLAGELVDISGDFNGDGYRDLAVQNSPNRISLFEYAGRGFPRQPAALLAFDDDAEVLVADVNADGLSDVALVPRDGGSRAPSGKTKVYFAQGE
ncbi:MAG TPA: VCBS repeat-containing protein [Candidatus Hydrogenedentes bacterium]|nr:VCBS repeat-containing protein [Candidatus Hydrogenedentota bacterium]HPG66686.1 VCBS repeat-containing protein [Candidatus Hydrogenedentota bacterium]